MKRKNTLVMSFSVIILLILVVGQGLLYLWFAHYQKVRYARALKGKIETVVGLFTSSSVPALQSNNYAYLDQYLEVLSKDEDILSVKITDEKGRVLKERTMRTETHQGRLNPFYIPWSNVYSAPISTTEGTLGNVEVVYSGQKANKDIRSLFTFPPVVQILVFIIVTYAIYFFFQKKVGIPVGRINEALARVTSGDLTVEVAEIEERELGGIANGLHFLVERLSKAISRFNSLSGDVSGAMEKLTGTLGKVNDTAKGRSKSIDEVISTIRAANTAQVETTENTEKLSHLSSENVSSLLQMKTAAEEIALSTGRLFKSAGDSYAMIAEMSQTSKAIAENAGEVSSAVEGTTASVEEISASLNAVRESTKKSADLTSQVRLLLTDRGTLAVADAIGAMEGITDEVNRFAKIVTQLDQRSKDIEKVLSVIKEVTEKTNLLSLNAAILAAQAGEYGKGFSVVANEIRSLSDRTSSSAREIAGIVGTIESEIHEAVNSIQSGVKKVEEGKELIYKSGEAMGETLEAAQKSAHMAAAVQRATEEQAEGLRQIRLSMENVSLMIDQVAKATEEQRKGSSHMLDSISDVKEVAELVKKGTEEHAVGTRVISKNLELTLEMVSRINQSAQQQQKANKGIIGSVDQMKDAGVSAIRDLEEVIRSFNSLREEVEVLKNETATFRTGKAVRGKDSTG